MQFSIIHWRQITTFLASQVKFLNNKNYFWTTLLAIHDNTSVGKKGNVESKKKKMWEAGRKENERY